MTSAPPPSVLQTVAADALAQRGGSWESLRRHIGIGRSSLRRLMRPTACRELCNVERCLLALALAIVTRSTEDAPWKSVAVAPTPCPIPGVLLQQARIPGILATIQVGCRGHGWGPVALARASRISVSTAHHLLHASELRALAPLEQVLARLGVEIGIIASDGAAHVIPLVPSGTPPPVVKSPRRPRRSLHPRGRLLISKAAVLDLHRHHGLSFARIAPIAGVGAERIRQIIRMFDAAGASGACLPPRRRSGGA